MDFQCENLMCGGNKREKLELIKVNTGKVFGELF